MGFMTTVTILNDAWDQIEANPKEFVEVIRMGQMGVDKFRHGISSKVVNSYGIGNCANPIKVRKSHHADEPKLYLVWQNSMIDIEHIEECNFKDYALRCLNVVTGILKYGKEKYKNIKDQMK